MFRRSRLSVLLPFAALALAPPAQSRPSPQSEGWTLLQGAEGLAVDYPAGIFRADAGPTEKGQGRKWQSDDGRYLFSAYTLANRERHSPRAYLRNNLLVPPESLIYRRVTDRFFVMSSIREGRIFYSRCNFAGAIYCIYMEYPQDEKRPFDPIVTRVSTSLRPR